MIKARRKNDLSLQNRFFRRRNNLSPYISLEQLAMFAPRRSQKILRKRRIRLQATYSTVTKILHNYVNLFDKLH